MTALALPRSKFNWPKYFFLTLLLAAMVFVAVETCVHAVNKHGDTALSIRDCLDKNGSYQVWKSLKFDNQFFRICELDTGDFGLQIVRQENGTWREVTSFIKGDGSWGQLMKYLSRIATRFNGTLH